MIREGKVFYKDKFAGIVKEDDEGFSFKYDEEYLKLENAKPISLTLPLTQDEYRSDFLFPFFDGLIPEGWILDIAVKNWKVDPKDRMLLLLKFCKDCIGAVSITEITADEPYE